MKQDKCKVFLVSGFLGSGKTTLLKNLLETLPARETAAVLMNEFGKAGVDGDVIRKSGLEIIEISRGSIFCACAKGDFLRGLYTIFRDYKPSMLLIEASGVADTTDMAQDLGHSILQNYYQLLGNICVVDAVYFEDWADLFCAVTKQIKAASHIIINKTDLVSLLKTEEIKKKIRKLNQDAQIIRSSFGNVSWSALISEKPAIETAPNLPLPEEWELFIEKTLGDMSAHLRPPDQFFSQSVFWEGDPAPFQNLLDELPEDLVRSKGYFRDIDGKWKLFDIVGHSEPTYSVPNDDFDASRNLAVFIRSKKARREIPDMFASKGIKILEIRFS